MKVLEALRGWRLHRKAEKARQEIKRKDWSRRMAEKLLPLILKDS